MEAVEGDLCSLRDGDGVAARLLESVPPDTLREEREDELSWLWRLNGNCALTLTIFPSFARTTEQRRSLSFWWSITRGCGVGVSSECGMRGVRSSGWEGSQRGQ